MCDQPDRRACRAGQGREDIAVLGELHVLEPDLPQLVGEHLAEVELFAVLGYVSESSSDCVSIWT